MADELDRAGEKAHVTGEELGQRTQNAAHQAHQHSESIADRVVNSGSDLGHATAEGAHHLAEEIHDAVAGGLGHLFHHDQPAAPPAETGAGETVASEGSADFDPRLDTPGRGSETV